MQCSIFQTADAQQERHHHGNWIQLLATFDLKFISKKKKKDDIHCKSFAFLSKQMQNSTCLCIFHSSESPLEIHRWTPRLEILRWIPHCDDIHEKSTSTSFQSWGMPLVLAKKQAFLLSPKGCLFLFVGCRVLACLFAFSVRESVTFSNRERQTKAHSLFAVFL